MSDYTREQRLEAAARVLSARVAVEAVIDPEMRSRGSRGGADWRRTCFRSRLRYVGKLGDDVD